VIVSNLRAPLVSVIIPTLEGGENLERCLAALAVQTFADFETIVVDNSGCGAAAPFQQAARVIEKQTNLGFGAAVNQGIEVSQAEYCCTINDDAFADPRWLAELVAACRDPEVGMCASQIRLSSSPDRLDSAGLQIYPDGSSKQRGRMAPACEFSVREEVLLPSACAALYRTAMLRQVGAFDPDFFLYCEDTDLGLRARRAGWRCLYVPSAVVYHRYSASAGPASERKAFYVERNRLYTVVKNFPVWTWPLVPLYSAWRYAVHLWGHWTGRGLAAQLPAAKLGIILFSANWEALKELPQLLAKRRAVMGAARLSGWEFWRLLGRHRISARRLALQP